LTNVPNTPGEEPVVPSLGANAPLIVPDDPTASIDFGVASHTAPFDFERSSTPNVSYWRVGIDECEGETPQKAALPDAAAQYVLRFPVAVGGCGEVWEATQTSLQRVVAVKRIQDGQRRKIGENSRERSRAQNDFRIEAITTAQLDHPNIVPVYDLGMDADGWPIMAMKLVRGDPWSILIRRDFDAMPVDDFLAKHLPIFVTAMQAVAFAHSRGVIHRDLKPSQVMVGEFGEVLLMDWGLAISAARPRSGPDAAKAILFEGLPTPATATSPSGTPVFMAPEQTEDTASGITFATDIYLLGGTLYQLLTGKYPRWADTSAETMRRAAFGEVIPLDVAAAGREIPRELAELTLKALSPKPGDRLPSVRAFIDGVRDYLSGATARRESECLVSAARERLATVAGRPKAPQMVASKIYGICSECLSELDRANALWPKNSGIAPLRGEVLEVYAETALRNDDLTLARGLAGLTDGGARRAGLLGRIDERERQQRRQMLQRRAMQIALVMLVLLHILGSYAYIRGQRDSARRISAERDSATEARAMAERANRVAHRLQGEAEIEQYFANIAVVDASLSRLLRRKAEAILLEKTPASRRNWEWGFLAARTFPGVMTLQAHDEISHAAFSPVSPIIYAAARDGSLVEFDANTGRATRMLSVYRSRMWDVKPSPLGDRLLTTSFDGDAAILDAKTGAEQLRLKGHTALVRGGAWSPDGKRVATTSLDRTVRIWNAQNGEAILTLSQVEVSSYACEFSPDGASLAVAALDATARVWDIASGSIKQELLGHTDQVLDIRYSPDGTRILTTSTDQKVRVFLAADGSLIQAITPPTSFCNAATFVRDATLIAGVTEDGVCHIWETETAKHVAQALVDSPCWKIVASPDDRFLLTGGRFSARMFSLDRLLARPQRNPAETGTAVWLRPPQVIPIFGLTAGRDRTWEQRERAWNTAEGRTLLHLGARSVAFDGRYTTFSPTGDLRFEMDPATLFGVVRRTADGSVVYTHRRVKLVTGLFSPDGSLFAAVEPHDKITLLDTATWKELHVLRRDPDSTIKVASELYLAAWAGFSPDSSKLVVPYLNERLVCWDTRTGAVRFESEKVRGIGVGVEFDPNGSRILVAGNDDRVTLWNAETGVLVQDFVGHARPVLGASFNPDGTRIVTFSRDDTVRLWEAATGREVLTIYNQPNAPTVVAARFTPDGMAVWLAHADGNARLLEAYPWRVESYAGSEEGLSMPQRIELWKRREFMDSSVAVEDILVMPAK